MIRMPARRVRAIKRLLLYLLISSVLYISISSVFVSSGHWPFAKLFYRLTSWGGPWTAQGPIRDLEYEPSPEEIELQKKEDSRILDLRQKLNLSIVDDSYPGCQMPNITIHNPIIQSYGFDRKIDGPTCSKEPDWLIFTNQSIQFSNQLASPNYAKSQIKCTLKEVIRVDDFKAIEGKGVNLDYNSTFQASGDFYTAQCWNSPGFFGFSKKWRGALAGIKAKNEVLNRVDLTKRKNKLNIVIIGFDSVSHVSFIRHLPKLYKYILDELNGVILDRYNVIGDGTTPALAALLTGHFTDAFPDASKGTKGFVDDFSFIYKEMRKERFVTLHAEDSPRIETWQYRMNGFNKPPSDHYFRPFAMMMDSMGREDYCLAARPLVQVFIDWVSELFTVYPKDVGKFAFTWINEYSHDGIETLNFVEKPMLTWLKKLKSSGILNDTVFMLMSDHGHRFSWLRSTLLGKYEERLPFFSIVLPPWFKDEYPKSFRAFQVNAVDRLTTPFDVHATIKSLLYEIADGQDIGANPHKYHPLDNKSLPRGLSLFREIPISRLCAQAEVGDHWCVCNDWAAVDPNKDPLAKKLATDLIEMINDEIKAKHLEGTCAKLSVKSIRRAMKMMPKKNLLLFKWSDPGISGGPWVPNLTGHTDIDEMTYEIQLEATPGDGIFEATSTYRKTGDFFTLTFGDISRINKYGSSSKCVQNSHPHLLKYCYCE